MREGSICVSIVAGDEAGDRLGARLIARLQQQRPELRFVGVAAPRMQAQGGESYSALDQLSTPDAKTAFGRSRSLRGNRIHLIERMLDARPALFVGIGAPEFNVPIARRMLNAGVPSVQYPGPALWNWRNWRARRIASSLSHALAVFPFEVAIYARAGAAATFVGHPLADSVPLDVDKTAARTQLRLPNGKRIVALMPGERPAEIRATGETFVKAARRFYSEVTDLHFVLPVTSRRDREQFESALRHGQTEEFPMTLLFGHAREALAAADLALVANETASLEAILFKTPMILAQPTTTTIRWWARRLMCGPTIGLPNRLAGEGVVPELSRRQATPWGLAAALMTLMRDAQAQRRQVDHFGEIHRTLRQDSTARASATVLALLEHGTA